MKVIAKAPMRRLGVAVGTGLVLLVALASFAAVGGQQALANFGPYNAQFLMGGVGLRESLAADAPVSRRTRAVDSIAFKPAGRPGSVD